MGGFEELVWYECILFVDGWGLVVVVIGVVFILVGLSEEFVFWGYFMW